MIYYWLSRTVKTSVSELCLLYCQIRDKIANKLVSMSNSYRQNTVHLPEHLVCICSKFKRSQKRQLLDDNFPVGFKTGGEFRKLAGVVVRSTADTIRKLGFEVFISSWRSVKYRHILAYFWMLSIFLSTLLLQELIFIISNCRFIILFPKSTME